MAQLTDSRDCAVAIGRARPRAADALIVSVRAGCRILATGAAARDDTTPLS
jgi:hypothetical protein